METRWVCHYRNKVLDFIKLVPSTGCTLIFFSGFSIKKLIDDYNNKFVSIGLKEWKKDFIYGNYINEYLIKSSDFDNMEEHDTVFEYDAFIEWCNRTSKTEYLIERLDNPKPTKRLKVVLREYKLKRILGKYNNDSI